MKAAQIKAYGSAENIIVQAAEEPEVVIGKVLVHVHAASLNPFDIAVREGHVAKNPELDKPLTLGGDFAGVVESVGPDVTGISAGDKVYGSALTLAGGSGGLAEKAVVPTKNLGLMPKNLDFAQAASLPLAGSSAVQAIYDHLDLQSGQSLFIYGASGGIGTIAIQIAKHLGAHVSAGIRGNANAAMQDLGADELIDTDSNEHGSKYDTFDAILNLVRGANFDTFYSIMKPGGKIVSLTGIPDDAASNAKDIAVIAQGTATNTEHLDKLRELVEQGAVKPVIAATYPLARIRDAFNQLEQSKTGKIVVTLE